MTQFAQTSAVSPLARYRLLSPKAAVRVSPICLGSLNFGTAWSGNMGASCLDRERSFEILDAWFAAGGNYIDTANGYQSGESEQCLGEWIQERGIRDQLVLSTKFGMQFHPDAVKSPIRVNFAGDHKKSMRLSLKSSLERLGTDMIRIAVYVHFWDYTTSIEELMQSLGELVRGGKVLYLGVSDTPAWIVAKANSYARHHGLPEFVIYQGLWSLICRDFEREIIPMCKAEGMAIAPYGVLGQGKFKTKAEIERRAASNEPMRSFWNSTAQSPEQERISAVLEQVAEEVGARSLGSVAVAYHLQKHPYVFPHIGARTVEQLQDSIAAASLVLTPAHIKALECVVEFKRGFPYDQFGTNPHEANIVDSWMLKQSGHEYDFVQSSKPIQAPTEKKAVPMAGK
ncbi:hypothetical protein HDU88_000433 [Geranomyces variabilis]|nr:hypothetical protein HDU88_000433 [Geranomyces variabilis]